MQFDQDGHLEVQHQLLITLVHGTWGRGFFPRLQRPNRRPFWFEDGSPFLARLSTELQDIPHKIKPQLWSGANSIFVRDKTAHALAEHLATEHAEHPQATQLVVAHSHGGNIALRALHHLQQRDSSQLGGADAANPLVVTLATPFIEVHHADFGRRPLLIRRSLQAVMMFLAAFITLPLTHVSDVVADALTIIFIISAVAIPYWAWRVHRRAAARQNKVEALTDATRLGEVMSAQAERFLIIRAIDDEASLILALGTILNYATARSIVYVGTIFSWILGIIGLKYLVTFFWDKERLQKEFADALKENVLKGPLLDDSFVRAFIALFIMLFGMLMVSRAVHGRELPVSPMECQINTQSTPDAIGLSKIVTLVRRSYVKSLRHGIYDHDDCAKTISDWVRFRLETN